LANCQLRQQPDRVVATIPDGDEGMRVPFVRKSAGCVTQAMADQVGCAAVAYISRLQTPWLSLFVRASSLPSLPPHRQLLGPALEWQGRRAPLLLPRAPAPRPAAPSLVLLAQLQSRLALLTHLWCMPRLSSCHHSLLSSRHHNLRSHHQSSCHHSLRPHQPSRHCSHQSSCPAHMHRPLRAQRRPATARRQESNRTTDSKLLIGGFF
jgi:hypothetical protein